MTETLEVRVRELDCAEEARQIEAALERLNGVADVRTAVSSRTALITYDPRLVAPEAIRGAIRSLGMTVAETGVAEGTSRRSLADRLGWAFVSVVALIALVGIARRTPRIGGGRRGTSPRVGVGCRCPRRRLPDLPERAPRPAPPADYLPRADDPRHPWRARHPAVCRGGRDRILHATGRFHRGLHDRARARGASGAAEAGAGDGAGRTRRSRGRGAGARGGARRGRPRQAGRADPRRWHGHRGTREREPGLDHRRVRAGGEGGRGSRVRRHHL